MKSWPVAALLLVFVSFIGGCGGGNATGGAVNTPALTFVTRQAAMTALQAQFVTLSADDSPVSGFTTGERPASNPGGAETHVIKVRVRGNDTGEGKFNACTSGDLSNLQSVGPVIVAQVYSRIGVIETDSFYNVTY